MNIVKKHSIYKTKSKILPSSRNVFFDILKKRIFNSKDEELKKQFSQELLLEEFMNKLNDINYNNSKDIDSLKEFAKKIEHLSDWPQNPQKFWDLEADFWDRRIDLKTKNIIINELKKYTSGNILNIGSGSFSYINSVSIDLSFEMLNWNKSDKRIQADACILPFKDNIFDSAIAVFVANYIKDLKSFVKEIRRILKNNSPLIIVQGKKIHELHQLAENKAFSIAKLCGLLRNNSFSVRKIEKENLIFLRCKKLP